MFERSGCAAAFACPLIRLQGKEARERRRRLALEICIRSRARALESDQTRRPCGRFITSAQRTDIRDGSIISSDGIKTDERRRRLKFQTNHN